MEIPQKLVKVLLVGNTKTGKSNILNQFAYGKFDSSSSPTIGVEFASKVKQFNNSSTKLQIWDTAGLERFRVIVKSYYKGARVVIIVFDLTDKESFTSINEYAESVISNTEGASIIIVGNKLDLVQSDESIRQVSIEVARQCASNYSAEYFEVSAKTGENINILFDSIYNNY